MDELSPLPNLIKRKYGDEEEEGGKNRKKERKNTETIKIYNLSTHTLLPYEIVLLNEGLTFAPTIQPNPFTLFKDVNKFIRDLTVKRFYNNKNNKPPPPNSGAKEVSPLDTPSFDYTGLPALADLEELYAENFYDDLDWLYTALPYLSSHRTHKLASSITF